MSDIDVMVREQLDRLVPAYGPPDWEAVLARAGRSPHQPHRRWLVIVAAATAVAVIVGVALAAALGGFSSWLTGQPGKPASPAEQRAFERANAHSFLGFPPGTQLRRLTTERLPSGVRIDLLGFRSQNTLCLRIVVAGKTRAGRQSCAPLAELRRPGPPVRVVLVDQGFGRGTKTAWYGVDRYHSSALQATAGIVADGVRSVIVEDDSGRHTVRAVSNSFLYVARNPNVGQRVRQISAVVGKRTVSIPFAPAPFAIGGGRPGQRPVAPGPTRVQREVHGGAISWLAGHEPRGQSLDVLPARTRTFVKRHTVFGRVIAPDPGQPLRVAVTLSTSRHGGKAIGICTWLVMHGGAGGGCSRRADLFSRGPITLGTGLAGGSDEFATASGLVSDDVARLVAYLRNGQTLGVPLADNVYAIQLPRAELPAKLVAYDKQGRIIGISEPIQDLGGVSSSPAPGKAKPLLRVVSPTGATLQLLIGKSTDGGLCMYTRWYESKRANGVGVSCSDFTRPGAPLQVGTEGNPAQFVEGRVYRTVATLELRYADGARETVKPVRTFVLYAIPREHLAKGHELVSVVAKNAEGRQIGSQSFKPPQR